MAGDCDAATRALAVLIGGAFLVGCSTGEPATGRPGTIPQPSVEGLEVAPESARVDLTMPTFSDPTNATNPLFPVSQQASVLLLGEVDALPFRTEVRLLPGTRVIEWEGQEVETLVSQYVAYLDGRLAEAAYDFYAQSDDGSVWYFGEDVFNFSDGAIADTHGSWLAGRDGPAAMIMPAEPAVGDVYRPENSPGLVFEEVTVKSVDETLDGPFGPISGGLRVDELHMGGAHEEKFFAPGYGEFYTEADDEIEALAMAVPTDAAQGEMPAEVESLATATADALAGVAGGDWAAATAATDRARASWDAMPDGVAPALVSPALEAALAELSDALAAQDTEAAGTSAMAAALLSSDLELRYRPVGDVDRARIGLWASRVAADLAIDDAAGVSSDLFALDYVRERLTSAISAEEMTRLNGLMEELGAAVAAEDAETATALAGELRAAATE